MAALVKPRGRRIRTALDEAGAALRGTAWVLGGFSMASNLLMLAPSLYMLQVYDRVMSTGHIETLVMLTLLAGAALLFFGLVEALRSAITTRMSGWLGERLGPAFLEGGIRARLAGDNSGAQPLRDLQVVQGFLASPGFAALFDIPWAPLFLLLIWMLHPALGILGLCAALTLLALGLLNEFLTRGLTLKASQMGIAATQQAETAIRNAEVVRAMGMAPALMARWCQTSDAAAAATRRSGERNGLLLGLTKFVRLFVQSAVLGLGAYLVLGGSLSAGGMIAASILLGRALAPVEIAMASWRNLALARIAYARLQSRMQGVPPERPRTRLPDPVGVLSVDKVSYAPPGAKLPALQGVSFRANPGEVVAVIGPSASGKSTLCRLLVGIAEPDHGEVRLDGSDLRHWNAAELGPHIGYLPQDVELFAGTVRENIARMGEADDEAVVEAAMLAHAHEVIQRLPQGYDTPIGDSGARLSGGQRQRIGLARAVYRNPKLIVLDEPNANLDQAGEAALAAALSEMKRRGATLLIVGHRPSTLAQADHVLVLRDGKVEVFGPRDAVLKRLTAGARERAAPAANQVRSAAEDASEGAAKAQSA
ncbi:type I secretion system permease/ATPase [Teichococcus oryzae]|uniref:Type I secretion system permease/ATPase n=1 Tax=Teichococcus oryzae TaxID=1608942 RepID=A0A5B2TD03_9PROT|nr:type I secretion system permease/ATPase [Pseudoroseomonas oryzae]KAA2211953.1 type I secretion system permease/ATPase [Pseudoroseomonas oryzae]